MIETDSPPADKQIVMDVKDDRDPDVGFVIHITAMGHAAAMLEGKDQKWCRKVEHFARKLAEDLELSAFTTPCQCGCGEEAPTEPGRFVRGHQNPTHGSLYGSLNGTIIRTTEYDTTQHWAKGGKVCFDSQQKVFSVQSGGRVPMIGEAVVHKTPDADSPYLEITIPASAFSIFAKG